MEFFLKRVLNILPKNIVRASITKNANIKFLDSRGSSIWAKKNKKSDAKDEKYGREEEKHEHAEYDTHVWLSPANAVKIVTNIANELEKVYPKKNYINKIQKS